ncbi:MAG: 30S ribosomal protein S6 [Pirellulales bacterium]
MEERTNVYEAMVIFDSNRFARDRAALPAEIEKSIKSGGGEVLVSRLWEERRLAYAIAGQRRGTYWLIYFRGPSSILAPLNREWEIHEGILRHLVLKVHPHLVDAVLEHAKTGPAPAVQPAPVAVAAREVVHAPVPEEVVEG